MATKGMWDTVKDNVASGAKALVGMTDTGQKVKAALAQERAKRALIDKVEEDAAPVEKDEPVKEIRFAKGGMVRRGYGKARGS
jgi:hypothetical protein